MQLPLGQREASMAEHCPVQLMPLPQVTLVTVMSLSQQPTSIDSLENVKEESKKTTSVVLVVPGETQEIVKQFFARVSPWHSDAQNPLSVEFPLHWSTPPIEGALQARARILNPLPQEAVHWDHEPHSCHSGTAPVISFEYKKNGDAKRTTYQWLLLLTLLLLMMLL